MPWISMYMTNIGRPPFNNSARILRGMQWSEHTTIRKYEQLARARLSSYGYTGYTALLANRDMTKYSR